MQKLTSAYGLNHKAIMDMFDKLNTWAKNQCLSSAGLAIGSGSKKAVKIANTVTYLSDGVFKSKSTAEVAFTATTMDISANADAVHEACYLITLAADGTPAVTMGGTSLLAGTAKLPELPATGTPIGYVRVAVAAGAVPFDATSDDLDAGHLTVAYVNLGYVAPRFDAVL